MEQDSNQEAVEETKPMIVGHLLIRDAETGEVIVNQRGDMVRQLTVGMDDVESE